jgi:hypothetical protein
VADKILPFPVPKPAPAPKKRLVRGIDTIPEHYELLIAWSALAESTRVLPALFRLADEAKAAGRSKDARVLRRAIKALHETEAAISGGFDVARMKALTVKYRALVEHEYPGAA